MSKKKDSGNSSDEERPLQEEPGASSKRKLLKSLAAGGTAVAALPAKWTTPLVDSVLTPAHAGISGPCGAPSCPGGGSASISAAVINGSGDLIVVGDYNVPGSCVSGGTASVACEVVDSGSVIGTNNRSTIAQGCNTAGVGCLVSCSVDVASGNHSLSPGGCVTLRINFDGNCVCSDVATIV